MFREKEITFLRIFHMIFFEAGRQPNLLMVGSTLSLSFHDKKWVTFYTKQEDVDKSKNDAYFIELFDMSFPKVMRCVPLDRDCDVSMPDRSVCIKQDDNLVF